MVHSSKKSWEGLVNTRLEWLQQLPSGLLALLELCLSPLLQDAQPLGPSMERQESHGA